MEYDYRFSAEARQSNLEIGAASIKERAEAEAELTSASAADPEDRCGRRPADEKPLRFTRQRYRLDASLPQDPVMIGPQSRCPECGWHSVVGRIDGEEYVIGCMDCLFAIANPSRAWAWAAWRMMVDARGDDSALDAIALAWIDQYWTEMRPGSKDSG